MSFSETIFLFFLALIIFGPKKLPEIARQAGKWMAEFRRASNEFKSQIEQEIANLEAEDRRRKILPPSPAPEGTASRTLNAAPSEPAQPNPSHPESRAAQAVPVNGQGSSQEEDEPLFATAPATAVSAEPPAAPAQNLPVSEDTTASPSQESHA